MASPIMTSGFSVQERPGINYLDPRLFASGLSEIVPNVGRGMNAVGQFYEMQNEAQMRPMRAALADIQLQEAQNRLAMAPLEQQIASLWLGEAQRQAAIPTELVESVQIIGGDTQLKPVDPNARFEDFSIVSETAPVVRRTGGTRFAAGGAASPFMRDETLKTTAQVEADAAKLAAEIRAKDALASQRSQPKQFEIERLTELYNSAVDQGDTNTAAIYKSILDRKAAMPGLIPGGTTYMRRVEQLAADAGLTLDAAQELVKTPAGAEALATMATANKAAAKSPFGAPTVTQAQREIIQRASSPKADALESAVSGVFSATRAPAAYSYSTVAEAEQAINSGQHQVGDEITVGTQKFTVQE